MKKTSRRDFIKAGAAAGLLVSATKVSANQYVLDANQEPAKVSPNDKIRFATIGLGIQGTGDTRNAVATGLAEFVAVADIYDGRRERAQEVYGKQIFTTRDYREILARKVQGRKGAEGEAGRRQRGERRYSWRKLVNAWRERYLGQSRSSRLRTVCDSIRRTPFMRIGAPITSTIKN